MANIGHRSSPKNAEKYNIIIWISDEDIFRESR